MIITNIDKRLKAKKLDDLIIEPSVVYVHKFDCDSAKKFAEEISIADNNDLQDIIPIVIDSYGGQVYTLLAMIDVIKSAKKKIATIAVGKAMSCGAVLFTCGHDNLRFIGQNATLMIHDVSSIVFGKTEDIKADAVETERLDKRIYSIMDQNCGQPDGYFKQIVHEKSHADWYIDSDEAVKHRLATSIRIPKFFLKISVDVKFV